MRKSIWLFLVFSTVFLIYGKTDESIKRLEESVTKDYDQDGKYSSYERALRRAQERIYVILPEKRGYWYTTLEKVKAEEAEIYPDVEERMKKK